MAVTVRIYDAKIDALFDRPGELRQYMSLKVAETVVRARAEAPTRTFALQRSIGSNYYGGGRWTITASSPHAKYVHEGTRPHFIRPRPGRRTLKFYWIRVGAIVYPVIVKHPGTTANPFLNRAMHQVWDGVGNFGSGG